MESGSHPDFSDPPVVETALGVDFVPLENWRTPHFGLFWQTIRDEFRTFEDQLPLPSEIEKFGEAGRQDLPRVELINQPAARCWFINESGNVLIQLQNGRFLQNWRKVTGSENYPRYEGTRPRFERDWKLFEKFLERQKLGNPQVRQCEVVYINHLERGKDWQSLSALTDVFPFLGRLSLEELRDPEAFRFDSRYVLPDKRGRLHLQIQPAVRNTDGKEIILFTLIARGAPYSSNTEDMLGWFDFGREWIHKAFEVFTGASVKAHWGKKEAE